MSDDVLDQLNDDLTEAEDIAADLAIETYREARHAAGKPERVSKESRGAQPTRYYGHE